MGDIPDARTTIVGVRARVHCDDIITMVLPKLSQTNHYEERTEMNQDLLRSRQRCTCRSSSKYDTLVHARAMITLYMRERREGRWKEAARRETQTHASDASPYARNMTTTR